MVADLASLDATAQAALIADGTLSAVEAMTAVIERIEALNPTLNAVIWSDPEAALAAAGAVDDGGGSGPFRGVPFLLKDIGAKQAGLPYWEGNRALRDLDHRSETDTELGRRFRSAGLLTLGKTNLPELGSAPTTQPLSFGPTANPWDLDRSPAGSSGGAGAAVAAGLVPMAHANDGGGSTRLPAAWCGLVGLKPTRGRVPYAESLSRNVSELVVSRTLRDTARILDAVHGPTEADLFRLAPPRRPYASELGAPVRPLRIALLTDAGDIAVDADCVAAVEDAARFLEAAGHTIEPVGPDVLLGGDARLNGRLWMAALAGAVDGLGRLAGRPLTAEEVEPYNWAAAERARSMPATELVEAQYAQQAWVMSVCRWLAPYDLLLTPTTPALPFRTTDLVPPADSPWRIGRDYGRIGAFTIAFNVTGHPAISLPLAQSAEGLPIGVQLVAPMEREDLLFRVGAHLEQAMPWGDRRPPVHA
ncbi:MAG: amidase [Actinomycetota bacterium]